MSKQQSIRAIRSEIAEINREIDLRIIRGVSYRREALRHKALMSQLVRLEPSRNIFARSMQFVSAFMF